jgi:hypothetical protein
MKAAGGSDPVLLLRPAASAMMVLTVLTLYCEASKFAFAAIGPAINPAASSHLDTVLIACSPNQFLLSLQV